MQHVRMVKKEMTKPKRKSLNFDGVQEDVARGFEGYFLAFDEIVDYQRAEEE